MMDRVDIQAVHNARQRVISQRDEVVRQIGELESKASILAAEITDFDVTIRTLAKMQPPPLNEVLNDAKIELANINRQMAHGEQRRMIETSLNSFGRDGVTLSSLREWIKNRHGIDISPNTLSVTLSRLKARGNAKLVGQDWFPLEPGAGRLPDNVESDDDADPLE